MHRLTLKLNMLFGIALFILVLPLSYSAQSSKEEKEQMKKFGSSLKKGNNKSQQKNKEKEKPENDEELIKIESNLFVSDFLVVNEQGQIVTNLKKEDFLIKEDNQLQQVEIFSLSSDKNIPRSIVLMIDFDTLVGTYLETSLDSLKILVGKLNPEDKVAIVTDDIKLIQPFTKDKELIKEKLDSLKKDIRLHLNIKGLQYETLLAILNEMFDEETQTRPIIIAQTVGTYLFSLKLTEANTLPPFAASMLGKYPDPESVRRRVSRRQLSYEDVYLAAEKSRATIYITYPGPQLIGYSQDEQIERYITGWIGKHFTVSDLKRLNSNRIKGAESYPITNQKVETSEQRMQARRDTPFDEQIYHSQVLLKKQTRLANLSQVTGGWMDFLENIEDADTVYSRIFANINQRYTIGYYSTNETKDKVGRIVKVEVKNHPQYKVIGRSIYNP